MSRHAAGATRVYAKCTNGFFKLWRNKLFIFFVIFGIIVAYENCPQAVRQNFEFII